MHTFFKVEGLKKHFFLNLGMSSGKARVRAVDDVSFEIGRHETLGLVGESGSGKTTVGRCVLRLIEPTGGRVYFEGRNLTALPFSRMKKMRRDMQIIFQDPFGSLTPRMRIKSLLKEPLEVHGLSGNGEMKDKVAEALNRVGLPTEYMERFPHELSGGQRQRVAIARALMLQPKLVVADEPVSALDVSIQAQVLNLLVSLQKEMGLSYLFISHDLSVVKYMADRVAVMYLGKIVELSDRQGLFDHPLHPYTEALLSAIPVPGRREKRERIFLRGEVPSPLHPPSGCAFHPRCRFCTPECRERPPHLRDAGGGHLVACHLRKA